MVTLRCVKVVYVMAALLFKYLVILLLKMNIVCLYWAGPVLLSAYVMGLGTGVGEHASSGFCGFSCVSVSGCSWYLQARGAVCGSSVGVAAKSVAWKFLYPLPRS